MKLLILALILFSGWAFFSGYRAHPENLPYYVKVDVNSSKQELKLTDGTSITGIIEEDAAEYVKVNADGLILIYKKSQIESMKSTAAPDFLTMIKKNYEANRSIHPLLTRRKEDTLNAKWDHLVMEPSRIADEIKKKNPGISQTEEMSRQMAANAQARLNDYKARQKAMEGGGQ